MVGVVILHRQRSNSALDIIRLEQNYGTNGITLMAIWFITWVSRLLIRLCCGVTSKPVVYDDHHINLLSLF
jgi:hypothetical protein